MITKVSKEEYLDVMQSSCLNKLEDHRVHVRSCLPREDREADLRDMMEAFAMDPDQGRAGILEIYRLVDVREALSRPEFKVENWQYDRTAGMLLLNLNAGVHEHLSAVLYRAYKGGPILAKQKEAAEEFISEGLGWFRSSSSYGRALKGKDVRLNFQERKAFGDQFMEMD
jgi:hypothetical protein